MFTNFMHALLKYRLSLAAILIFAASAALAYHIHTSSDAFARAYRDYAVVAEASDLAAYIPAAPNNPVRSNMNTILIEILSKKMSDAERLADAQKGLELLSTSQKQIDAITTRLNDTDAAEARLSASTDFLSSFFSNGLPQKILAQVQARHAAISDIRAYSYRADFETQQIFKHIVDSKGVLADSYVLQLNNDIPAEEQEFNARQNRYYDLQNIADGVKQDFADFETRFSLKNTGE